MNLKLLLLQLPAILCCVAQAQSTKVNLNAGTWKNPDTWLGSKMPNDTEHVILIQDLLVDTVATCRSLTTNGFAVTIATGASLNITGNDTTCITIPGDTLLVGVEYYDSASGAFLPTGPRFQYDSLKRLIYKIDSIEDEPIAVSRYQYAGGLRQPQIITRSKDYGSSTRYSFDTSYLFYDNLGLIVEDSLRFVVAFDGNNNWTSGTTVSRYSYNNGGIIKTINTNTTRFVGGNGDNSATADTQYFFQEKVHDAILYQADTIMDFNTKTVEHTFKLDTHPNPFYRLPAESPLFPVEHYFSYPPYQKNNIVEETATEEATGGVVTDNIYYRYNTLGYPGECFLYENSHGRINYRIIRFRYAGE